MPLSIESEVDRCLLRKEAREVNDVGIGVTVVVKLLNGKNVGKDKLNEVLETVRSEQVDVSAWIDLLSCVVVKDRQRLDVTDEFRLFSVDVEVDSSERYELENRNDKIPPSD